MDASSSSNRFTGTTHPVFIKTGITEFLYQFNREALREGYDPNPDSPMYPILRTLIIETFANDIKQLGNLQSNILLRVDCTSWTYRSFFPLTEKGSISAFVELELKFIWAILQARCKRTRRVFTFNETQAQALDHLLGALEGQYNGGRSHSTALEGLYSVFDAIYFPGPGAYDYDTYFNMPSTTFLALQCVAADGSYRSIHLIPPIIAKLRYSLRLRATRRITFLRDNLTDESAFFQHFEEFCMEHLQDRNVSPFSALNRLSCKMNAACKSIPRPDIIWWHGDVTASEDIGEDNRGQR
ncbi:hypothetical protein M413DRAFT_33085 [Hebeloma cylindrosporum]|uniref:Uncharacterized protein n=1 Tax=Hebeloma cylindrosporum TaxID=76867 RepID=A0A0C2Y0T2_HEBCY|nr:hypothetical protein M413DRAFT_33085 [Hebeloma cylindrosporum h7]